jgi:Protein of unknown function (DUF2795)
MAQAEFIEVQNCFAGVHCPASKQRLVEHAKKSGASRDVLEALSAMPEGEYDGPNRVSSAVAKS